MNYLRALFCAAFFSLLCVGLPQGFAQSAGPQAALEDFLGTIRTMEFPVQDAQKHEALVQKADGFLDMDTVGKNAIAEYWQTISADQRSQFLELFWKLIEKTAYRRSHDFLGNLKITYPETKPDASGFLVKSIVRQEAEGIDTEILYHLSQKDGLWKVDDVVLDGVSIVEDLKYQFDKIVKDSSFDGLLVKMRERLAQAEKDASAPVSA